MSIMAFAELMRQTNLMRDDDLSLFSDQMVRESALDKEFVDTMSLCMKLEVQSWQQHSPICPFAKRDAVTR